MQRLEWPDMEQEEKGGRIIISCLKVIVRRCSEIICLFQVLPLSFRNCPEVFQACLEFTNKL